MADGEPPKPPPPLEESVKQSQLSSQILYSDVVKAPSQPYSQQSFELNTNDTHQIFDAESSSLKEISVYQGKPLVVFSFSDKQVLVDKLKYVLVGKFSHGRPPMDTIKKFFVSLKHKGTSRICVELDVGKPLLDAILISFKDEVSKNILEKFWVKVFYDEVPLFCSFCSHIGHGTGACKRRLEKFRSGQGKAEIISADKVFDNMPQPENSTNSTKFEAGNCGSKMGKQIRPSKEWQPVGKHVPNARSNMGNKVAPESSAQIPLMQNTGNEVKNLVLENSFKELASLDKVRSITETQLTRKSPVAANNAKKHAEATEERSALPPLNTPTSRAHLVEKEGRNLVPIADSLNVVPSPVLAEEVVTHGGEAANVELVAGVDQIGGVESACVDADISKVTEGPDLQHGNGYNATPDLAAKQSFKPDSTEKTSEGFTHPEASKYQFTYPNSWADSVEEEEQQTKGRQ
ncbi:hypothetical protein LIER_04839 [Lithospermum erythrorhizon]|uniref:DUF4283 domain-containing protein n=1 Tax=Lithospermum erythrorhizon TaxID=34254 RepID=A0AAV3NZI3_LITER